MSPFTRRHFLASTGASIISSTTAQAADPQQYERKYDPLTDLHIDLGAVYIPFMGDKWNCTPAKPTIGQYDDLGAVNRHIDQMQGHGVSTLMFNYGESPRDFDRVRSFLDKELSSEISVETMWVIKKIFTRDLDIDKFISFARENLLPLPNHSTIDGRPVVQLWASNYLPWHDETANRIKDEWGGFREFADYIQSGLTIDETEPYIVTSITDVPDDGLQGNEAVWNSQFDAVTTWFPNPRKEGKSPWDWYIKRAEEDFQVLRQFADKHNLDLIPTAFPGRDGRYNTCWGDEPHVPRSPDHLTEMLKLADEYRTRDRINLATYNGWVEGHQVEPGQFHGRDYGTAYLKSIKEFQKMSLTTTSTTTPQSTTTTLASPEEQTTSTANQTRASSPGFGLLTSLAALGLSGYRRLLTQK